MTDARRLRLLQLLSDIEQLMAEAKPLVVMSIGDEAIQRRATAELLEMQNALRRIDNLLNPGV